MDPKNQIDEMDDSYADGGYASMAPTLELPALASITTPDGAGSDMTLAIGAPESTATPKNITVYASSINPVSYGTDDPVVAFDVVFSVGIACPESGNTKTYQVVKRIGVNRQKIATDAEATTPVSIVEAKKSEPSMLGKVSTARFKALAGLK